MSQPRMINDNNDSNSTNASTEASTVSTTRNYPSKKRQSSQIATGYRIAFDNCSEEHRDRSQLSLNRSQDSLNRTNKSQLSLSQLSFSRKRQSNESHEGSRNPQESLNGRHNEEAKKTSRALTIGRELFVVFILITAGVFGSMAYYVLSISEETLATEQYVSVTSGALKNVRNSAENKLVHGSQIMAKHVGWAYPQANDSWPFIWLPSYWDIMEEVLPTSIWSGMNLAPIVMPEQAAEFEDFAYTKIAETFGENTTLGATSHFGKGIWVKDELRVNTVDNRYHDTTGVPIYPGSPYNYMAPKLQDGLITSPYTMMNVHGFETPGLALDAVMNCSIARKERHSQHNNIFTEEDFLDHSEGCIGSNCAPSMKNSRCSALSGMLTPKSIKDDHGIAGFIATPIYPANNPYDLVGFIYGIVYWEEVMTDIFPQGTVGIDCVFNDPNHQYTYTLDGSNTSTLICGGDCHDPKYDELMMTTAIIDPNLLSEESVTYHLTCYPNDDFFLTYRTTNPTVAAVGCVGIILFTSILFFLYDYFVRREIRSKKHLFEAKRKFVRFVSHEVRTPMNSVCMGLSILQEEAALELGIDTSGKNAKRRNKKQQAVKGKPSFNKAQIEHWFDLANEISANAQASVDVLDDFLHYDKIATGEMNLEYTIIPIWNLIQETIAEFKLPMTKKKITLHSSLPNPNELPKTPWYNRSGSFSRVFSSDDTLQLSNLAFSEGVTNKSLHLSNTALTIEATNKTKDDDISDMESGFKDEVMEEAKKQKLVGDSVRITQVIRNLVSNAIKFSSEGGDIYIETNFVKGVAGGRKRLHKKGKSQKTKKSFELKSKEVIDCEQTGEVVFTIKDTGAGLSRTQLKNLFGAGVQFDVNELQSGKGSGLGLYIAKGIVEQHDGSLVADSDGKGLGCTFTMRLPIYKPPEELWNSAQFMQWKRRRPRTRHSFERAVKERTVDEGDEEEDDECTLKSLDSRDDGMSELKILIVDDSKSNRKLLDRLMTMRGHKCYQADDGHKGVEMVMNAEAFGQPFDLVFMDYQMPTMTGPEAVKQIRAEGCSIYIIGLTGNCMADDIKYFHACGANAVFAKPFKVREFEQHLEENLSRDFHGRIVEAGSAAFEMSTLGLMEEQGGCPGDLDNTGTSSLQSLDRYKSWSSMSTERKELEYEEAKRALRDSSC